MARALSGSLNQSAVWIVYKKATATMKRAIILLKIPTIWTSASCWYHEHLKSNEGQGLRAGFEPQYCKQCWNNDLRVGGRGEWMRGKVMKFSKVGSGRIGEEGRGTRRGQAPDQPECCAMCQRLLEKGFEGTCSQFSGLKTKKLIEVVPGSMNWHWADGVDATESKSKTKFLVSQLVGNFGDGITSSYAGQITSIRANQNWCSAPARWDLQQGQSSSVLNVAESPDWTLAP